MILPLKTLAQLLCCCCLLAGMLPRAAHGQQLQPYALVAEDFLGREGIFPVYDIEVDSLDYTYFAGNGGLARFNGTELHHYAIPDGRSTMFLGLQKMTDGGIWAFAKDGTICGLQGDSLHVLPLPPDLKTHTGFGVTALHVDANGTAHIGTRVHGYWKLHPDARLEAGCEQDTSKRSVVVTAMADGSYFHWTEQHHATNFDLHLQWQHADGSRTMLGTLPKSGPIYETTLVERADSSLVLSLGNTMLVHFTPKRMLDSLRFTTPLIRIFNDSQDRLWLSTFDKGIYQCSSPDLASLQKLYGDATAAVVAENSLGGLWIKDAEDFFAYLPKPSHMCVADPDVLQQQKLIRKVKTGADIAYFSNGTNRIGVIEQDSLYFLTPPTATIPNRWRSQNNVFQQIGYHPGTRTLVTGDFGRLLTYHNGQWREHRVDLAQHPYAEPRGFSTPMGNALCVSVNHEVFRVNATGMRLLHGPADTRAPAWDVEVDADSNSWVGGRTGLWIGEGDHQQRPYDPMPPALLTTILDFGLLRGRVIASTEEGTAYELHRDTAIAIDLHNNGAFHLFDFAEAPNGDLWARSKLNNYLLHFDAKASGHRYQTHYFSNYLTEWSPSGAMGVTETHVWLGGSNGLHSIPVDEVSTTPSTPRTIIREPYVNHVAATKAELGALHHTRNTLNFVFEGVSYEANRVKFRYRMVGLDSAWITTRYGVAQYTNLAPGSYTFEVQASSNVHWSTSATLPIHIQQPYWQTWWFRTLIVLGLLLIGFASAWIWTRNLRKRSQLQIKQLKAEQRALRAQMNPHFMFNALASIQQLVVNNDALFAVSNISRFAQLMRKVLHQSSVEAVSIAEECELLRDYLELEALRFDGRFTYKVLVAEGLDERDRIPPMLVQPFVENAVKHGYSTELNNALELLVELAPRPNGVRISIDDNGIGREAASRIRHEQRPGHRSVGMRSVQQRIDFLNAVQPGRVQLEIIDKQADDGSASGTLVRLLIERANGPT